MDLTDIYQKGEQRIREKEFGWVLDAVETGFIVAHDRRILDRYTFRPQYIDAVAPKTACRVLGVELATPVIMSAMTMPITAITDNGLMEVAEGLKAAGSLMAPPDDFGQTAAAQVEGLVPSQFLQMEADGSSYLVTFLLEHGRFLGERLFSSLLGSIFHRVLPQRHLGVAVLVIKLPPIILLCLTLPQIPVPGIPILEDGPQLLLGSFPA